jgi:hypothetical protein
MTRLELELEGRVMADPLSLSDFPSLAQRGCGVVRAVVDGASELEEEKERATDEGEGDGEGNEVAKDLASLNDEDLADQLQRGAHIR